MSGMENIVAVFNAAHPHEVHAGQMAYRTYHAIVTDVAQKYGYSASVGAAVFSALSPNNDYMGNLRDVNTLLSHHRLGRPIDSFMVSTYHQNKRKAWAIAGGEDPLKLIVAPKTRNFYLNVYNPEDPLPVTIDGHMHNLWEGVRRPLASRDPLVRTAAFPPRVYNRIADAFRAFAQAVRILPNQVQAIVWLTWRRQHGIKTTAQTFLWDVEREVAGLGFGGGATS